MTFVVSMALSIVSSRTMNHAAVTVVIKIEHEKRDERVTGQLTLSGKVVIVVSAVPNSVH